MIICLTLAWGMLFVDMRSFRSMRYAQVMRYSVEAILIWDSHQHIAPHSIFFSLRAIAFFPALLRLLHLAG